MAFKDVMKSDLAFAIKEIGSPVSYNGYDSFGILLNEPVDVLQLGENQFAIQDTILTLTIVAGSIGAIKSTTALNTEKIFVECEEYKIDKYITLSNGLQTKIWLSGVN